MLISNVFIIIIAISLFNFLIDPLQFYRKASYRPVFSTNQRLQNPGLAKNYDYNTIIIGTSLTDNFRSSYINDKWGCTTLKLPIAGSSLKEQSMLANVVMRSGKVATVLWGLDITSATGSPDEVRQATGQFPYYLYNDSNILNDIKYIFSGTTTRFSVTVLASNLLHIKTEPLETLNDWKDDCKFDRSEVVKTYEKSLNKKIQNTGSRFENYKENFEQNVIQVIEKNSDKKFILFFPPNSMPFYHSLYLRDPYFIEDWIQCKLYLLDKLSNRKNVEIFDFQDDYETSYNLNNYKDMLHYSPNINQHMFDEIAKGGFIVNDRQEYLRRLSGFKAKVISYSIMSN